MKLAPASIDLNDMPFGRDHGTALTLSAAPLPAATPVNAPVPPGPKL